MRYHELLTEGRTAYLFHGTDLLSAISIIRDNQIDASQHYEHHTPGVSLARDYLAARAFGTYWERQCPVVFVLDQEKLVQSTHKVVPYRDTSEPGVYRERESEELIHGSLPNLNRYLVSVNVDMDHLEAALQSRDWWRWLRSEIPDLPHLKYLNSRGAFLQMIDRYIVKHPKLNKWVPRVSHAPGSKDDGKPWLGEGVWDSLQPRYDSKPAYFVRMENEPGDDEYPVWVNPSANTVRKIIDHNFEVRACLTKDGKLYIWDHPNLYHSDVYNQVDGLSNNFVTLTLGKDYVAVKSDNEEPAPFTDAEWLPILEKSFARYYPSGVKFMKFNWF